MPSVETGQMSAGQLFAAETGRIPAAEKGQMYAAETGQMYAAGTGQMSGVETKQMSSVARADICLVPTHNVEVSEVSTVPIMKSQKSQLWQCHNQVSDRRSGPRLAKMVRNGSGMVARS